ncbi:hypothetical protein B0H11DRAFT_1901315 [Mycena galericulata]|nr:hypothetical protein B0H11DRAFT_1901315 [Mycena galericulata]
MVEPSLSLSLDLDPILHPIPLDPDTHNLRPVLRTQAINGIQCAEPTYRTAFKPFFLEVFWPPASTSRTQMNELMAAAFIIRCSDARVPRALVLMHYRSSAIFIKFRGCYRTWLATTVDLHTGVEESNLQCIYYIHAELAELALDKSSRLSTPPTPLDSGTSRVCTYDHPAPAPARRPRCRCRARLAAWRATTESATPSCSNSTAHSPTPERVHRLRLRAHRHTCCIHCPTLTALRTRMHTHCKPRPHAHQAPPLARVHRLRDYSVARVRPQHHEASSLLTPPPSVIRLESTASAYPRPPHPSTLPRIHFRALRQSKMEIEKKQSKKICTIHAICVGEARVHTSSGVQPGSAMKGVSNGRVTMERMRERGKREEEEEKTACARSEVKDDEQGIRNEFERMSGEERKAELVHARNGRHVLRRVVELGKGRGCKKRRGVAGDGRQQGAGDGTEGGGATARTREVEDAKRGRKEGWIELSGNTREGDAKKLAHTIGELAEGVKEAVRVGAVAVPLEEVGFVNGLRTKEVSLERNERKGDLLYAAAAGVPEADAAAVPRGAWPGARYTVISALEKNVVNDKEERKRMGFEEERRRGRYRPSRSKPPHTPPISHQYIRVHAPPTNLDLIASRASSFDEGPACGHLCIYPADGLWTDAMGDTLPTYIRLWAHLRYNGHFCNYPWLQGGGRGAMHYQHTYTIGLSQIRSTSKVAT